MCPYLRGENESSVSSVIMARFLYIFCSVLGILTVMNIVKYTTRMETRIRIQATQYLNLINRMREGVIVLADWQAS